MSIPFSDIPSETPSFKLKKKEDLHLTNSSKEMKQASVPSIW